jgi:hypothetical protein
MLSLITPQCKADKGYSLSRRYASNAAVNQ